MDRTHIEKGLLTENNYGGEDHRDERKKKKEIWNADSLEEGKNICQNVGQKLRAEVLGGRSSIDTCVRTVSHNNE